MMRSHLQLPLNAGMNAGLNQHGCCGEEKMRRNLKKNNNNKRKTPDAEADILRLQTKQRRLQDPKWKKKLHGEIEGARLEFEEKKRRLLQQVPQCIQAMWGQIGFARSSSSRQSRKKCYNPVLIVGPYDVAPGPARNSWMDMFEKLRENGRPLEKMPFLIYAYGDDLVTKNYYELVPSSSFVKYDDSTQEMKDFCQSAKHKRVKGQALTTEDKKKLHAEKHLLQDLAKPIGERKRGDMEGFQEEYNLISLSDAYDVVLETMEDDDSSLEERSIAVEEEMSTMIGSLPSETEYDASYEKEETVMQGSFGTIDGCDSLQLEKDMLSFEAEQAAVEQIATMEKPQQWRDDDWTALHSEVANMKKLLRSKDEQLAMAKMEADQANETQKQTADQLAKMRKDLQKEKEDSKTQIAEVRDKLIEKCREVVESKAALSNYAMTHEKNKRVLEKRIAELENQINEKFRETDELKRVNKKLTKERDAHCQGWKNAEDHVYQQAQELETLQEKLKALQDKHAKDTHNM